MVDEIAADVHAPIFPVDDHIPNPCELPAVDGCCREAQFLGPFICYEAASRSEPQEALKIVPCNAPVFLLGQSNRERNVFDSHPAYSKHFQRSLTELWKDPVYQTREGDRVSDVFELADPHHSPLHTHSETGMGHRPITTKVNVPLVIVWFQIVFVDPLEQQFEVVDALATSRDLSISFRCQQICGESYFGILRIRHVVECFECLREMADKEWFVEALGEYLLFFVTYVSSPLEVASRFLDELNSFVVRDSGEGTHYIGKLLRIASQKSQFFWHLISEALADMRHKFLFKVYESIQIEPRRFNFQMPILGQMAPGSRFLCTE